MKCTKCNEGVDSDVIKHRCVVAPNPILDMIGFFSDPMRWAAQRGQELAKLYATHDPCTSCGHGRLLHKKTAIVDPATRAADDALSEKACRHGHYHTQAPQVRTGCECQLWSGIETPIPGWALGIQKVTKP